MDVLLFKDYGRAKRNRLLIDWNLKWKGQRKAVEGKWNKLYNSREVWYRRTGGVGLSGGAISCLCL